ncbi:MAG: DUF427 domain-containing protein [Beijerinckiaceae bacterium]
MRATWNNIVIAQSDDIVTVEGNAYFPMASLNRACTAPSATHTTCGWKGIASYFDIVVNGQTNKDAAWYYPQPKAEANQVADRVAFWKGVKVEQE